MIFFLSQQLTFSLSSSKTPQKLLLPGGSSNAGAEEGSVSGFVMCKVTPKEAEAAAAAGVAAPNVAEEEGAAEQNEAAIEQATAERLELMAPVVAGLKASGA